MDSFIKLIVSLLIFVFVLFITYFTTRYIANIQKKQGLEGNISIVEAKRLSNNKILYIVRIGEEYFALASGKDSVNLISKLDSAGLKMPRESSNLQEDGQNFSKILEKFKKKQDKE